MAVALKSPSRVFSLTEGGPTYRLERRLGLTRENRPRILRMMGFFVLLTWVPLLVLSALQGTAFGNRVPVSFLRDFAVHARFLVAVPLLLVADLVVGPEFARAAREFVDSHLVREEDFPQFDCAVERGIKWSDSTIVEAGLFVLAYAITSTTLSSVPIHVSTWYALRTSSGFSLTWAGWWFVFFCVPLFQFLTLRWLWRQFLWGQFLWRMSRLNLQLMPIHPDRAAGLGFVGVAQRFFGIILLADSFPVAAVIANSVFYDKVPLRSNAGAIVGFVVIAVAVALAPLVVFLPTLARTKRSGLYTYGALATSYTLSFHKKWVADVNPQKEPLLGTSDIQSLADLGNSFSYVQKMNFLPVGPRTLILFVVACLIPMTPLLFSVIPMNELVRVILKVVL